MKRYTKMIQTLKIVWWVSGIALFIYTVKNDGITMGVLNWLNPLTPP
jgi:hypothetical protein